MVPPRTASQPSSAAARAARPSSTAIERSVRGCVWLGTIHSEREALTGTGHLNGGAPAASTPPPALQELEARAREWEIVIRRCELISLAFYILMVGVLLLMFFCNSWRKSI